MKKLLMIAVIIGGTATMTSCKKEITCACTQVDLTVVDKTTKAKSGEEDQACLDVANKVLGIPTEICIPK
jgi:hypothetical protein